MSFWAALVILNLASIIPIIGDRIVLAILSGSSLTSAGLARFFSVHFLLAFIALGLAMAHLFVLHRTEPGSGGCFQSDGTEVLVSVLAKDFAMLPVLLFLFLIESVAELIHPDN